MAVEHSPSKVSNKILPQDLTRDFDSQELVQHCIIYYVLPRLILNTTLHFLLALNHLCAEVTVKAISGTIHSGLPSVIW